MTICKNVFGTLFAIKIILNIPSTLLHPIKKRKRNIIGRILLPMIRYSFSFLPPESLQLQTVSIYFLSS